MGSEKKNVSNITQSHPRDQFYPIWEQDMIQVFVTASRTILEIHT